MSASPNFVWCLECPSGQHHEDGNNQPIVQCQACHARSCFTHRVPWHENFTCGQYDKLAAKTENFMIQGKAESNNWRTRLFRLFQLHPLISFSPRTTHSLPSSNFSKSTPDLNISVATRQAEADAKRLHDAAAQQKKLKDAILKRQRQEEASLKTIRHLCKVCPGPGCNWPIEKKDGCSHMTCKISFHFRCPYPI